jgi:branched-chain amino acid aminotransferase
MILWQGNWTKAMPEPIAALQRALYYGDALFETMRLADGQIELLDGHLERLNGGMRALGMGWPLEWYGAQVLDMLASSGVRDARVRLSVWRRLGGGLGAAHPDVDYCLELGPLPPPVERPLRVGICGAVRLATDGLSRWKSLQMPRYAAAAREAARLGWDDALVLNAHGRIAESSMANVFWEEDGVWYTPPLSEGCVAGVMRAWMLEQRRQQGEPVAEDTLSPDRLAMADRLWLTNALRGIMPAVYTG